MNFDYRVEIFKESAAASILLGGANTRKEKLQESLKMYGSKGWELVTIEREIQRVFIFWKREVMVAIFKKAVA